MEQRRVVSSPPERKELEPKLKKLGERTELNAHAAPVGLTVFLSGCGGNAPGAAIPSAAASPTASPSSGAALCAVGQPVTGGPVTDLGGPFAPQPRLLRGAPRAGFALSGQPPPAGPQWSSGLPPLKLHCGNLRFGALPPPTRRRLPRGGCALSRAPLLPNYAGVPERTGRGPRATAAPHADNPDRPAMRRTGQGPH